MAKTNIRPAEILSAGAKPEAAKQKVASAKNGVREVGDRLEAQVKSKSNISGRLNALANSLGGIESKIGQIKNAADTGAAHYQRTDDRLTAQVKDLG